jgi:LuxR family maltose regulon positive regulatory protein
MAGLLKQYGKHYRKQKDREGVEALATYAGSLFKQTQENLWTILAAHGETAAAGTRNLLTAQEKKVLEMVLKAYSNKEIADKLAIGVRTVKTYTGNIYSKLGVKNRAQCVKLAREIGFFE